MIGKGGTCVGAAEHFPQFLHLTQVVLGQIRSFIERELPQ
jgi:hypothetical protein